MTFSLIARDSKTGALGTSVASRFFAVGALCIHVEGGVGAVSTQALINPLYGPDAIGLLRDGQDPATIIDTLVQPDPGRAQRQLHIIDAAGRIAQHTGPDCVSWAGHAAGADCSAAGNMLAGHAVIEAMLDGFTRAEGDFAHRLLSALEAGEAQGGDKRGRQSAALKICTADSYSDVDIRADDHPDPLAELRRLHRVSGESYAVFRRFLAGSRSRWGETDRRVIEAAMQAHAGKPE